ncbi:MAG: FAD binding domain-containing protein [Pseudomonadales bacterium]|nr:FAD binding domain-containing protein [Pseudomonadales bacterium]
MQGFAYEAPSSLDALRARLAAAQGAGELTQVLAGGTDLLVQMKQGQRAPGLILDIKRVGETQALTVDGDWLTIGASVPAAKAKAFPLVAEAFPGLAHAIDLIGSSQIQGRASLGGNLCNASPAGDTIPALIANGFEAQILTADGLRTLPVEAFVTGVGKNALASGEVLLALKAPVPGPRSGDAYQRFTPRTEMDIAVVGVGARLTLDDAGVIASACIALGAVAPQAFLAEAAGAALVGTRGEPQALEAAAAAAMAVAKPISDKRGSADFRRRICGVLVKRVVAQALERCTTGGTK